MVDVRFKKPVLGMDTKSHGHLLQTMRSFYLCLSNIPGLRHGRLLRKPALRSATFGSLSVIWKKMVTSERYVKGEMFATKWI